MSRFGGVRKALEENGWRVGSVELASNCWWAKEIWEMISIWSPMGRRLYLSILIDPAKDIDDNNPPDEAVWAIAVTEELPSDRPLSGISMGRRLEKAIQEIVRTSNSMRNSAQ